MGNSCSNTVEYLSVKEVAELTGKSERQLRRYCINNKCVSRIVDGVRGGNKGKSYEILVSSLEVELQEKIYNRSLNYQTMSGNYPSKELTHNKVPLLLDSYAHGGDTSDTINSDYDIDHKLSLTCKLMYNSPISLNNKVSPDDINTPDVPAVVSQPVTSGKVIPEKAKQIALAKVDVISLWDGYCHGQKNKAKASKEFVKSFNNNLIDVRLHTIIGDISVASLYRWNKTYKESNKDYYSLVPDYNYGSDAEILTQLSDEEQKAILQIMLHPNKFDIGAAYSIIKYNFAQRGLEVKSKSSYVRFINKYKTNNYDIWTLMREGEKALKDKVAHYNQRDWSKIGVGDMFVADGNVLDCQCINPFTGKPCRATLVTYMDAFSWYVAGYEIMLTENTQCISSALRNAIIHFTCLMKVKQSNVYKGRTSLSSSSTNTQYPSAKCVWDLLTTIYPVGSVYLSTNSTCPLSALFGTWELVSSDRALWTGTGSNGNTTIAAGLPDIVGTLTNMYSTGTSLYNNSGAFGNGSGLTKHGGFNSGTNYNHDYDVDFHASYYNTIYSDSVTTVQPPAYVVNVWRRTA